MNPEVQRLLGLLDQRYCAVKKTSPTLSSMLGGFKDVEITGAEQCTTGLHFFVYDLAAYPNISSWHYSVRVSSHMANV